MSQARVSFISDYQLRDERVLALPKPRALTFGIPFYALVAMVLIGMTGVCATVLFRSQAELQAAQAKYADLQGKLAAHLVENDRLEQEVKRLDADPRAIERSMRETGLVKANEVVIAIEEPAEATDSPRPAPAPSDSPKR